MAFFLNGPFCDKGLWTRSASFKDRSTDGRGCWVNDVGPLQSLSELSLSFGGLSEDSFELTLSRDSSSEDIFKYGRERLRVGFNEYKEAHFTCIAFPPGEVIVSTEGITFSTSMGQLVGRVDILEHELTNSSSVDSLLIRNVFWRRRGRSHACGLVLKHRKEYNEYFFKTFNFIYNRTIRTFAAFAYSLSGKCSATIILSTPFGNFSNGILKPLYITWINNFGFSGSGMDESSGTIKPRFLDLDA